MLLLNAYSIYCQTVVQIKDILANLSYSYRRRHSGTCFSTHAITDARGAVYKIDVQLKKILSTVEQCLPPPPSPLSLVDEVMSGFYGLPPERPHAYNSSAK